MNHPDPYQVSNVTTVVNLTPRNLARWDGNGDRSIFLVLFLVSLSDINHNGGRSFGILVTKVAALLACMVTRGTCLSSFRQYSTLMRQVITAHPPQPSPPLILAMITGKSHLIAHARLNLLSRLTSNPSKTWGMGDQFSYGYLGTLFLPACNQA